MSIQNLDRIFAPRSVAVIGASARAGSVGNTVLHNLTRDGFGGEVYAVNPKHAQIDGLRCFASLDQLPEVPDLAVLCTPAITVPQIVHECGVVGVRGLVILSAGFGEASASGAELESRIRKTAAAFEGMRIIGPNCLGIMSPHLSLNASFAGDVAPKGNIAFISQSGALCTAILDWAIQEGVGFSQFVSLGNMIDVGIGDLIDYFALDAATESIILYVESLSNARGFMSAARAFSRNKPIVAYKAGRFEESAKAAASHTGAMAGVDRVYDAAFRRAGIVRVFDVEELFDCAELLSRHKIPAGPRLAIVTNAGGPGVMATDALLERQGRLARLSSGSIEQLDRLLPAAWSRGNPIDVLGDATPQRFSAALQIALADPDVDGVLVVLSPQAMTDPTGAAQAVIECANHSHKPVLASWMGGGRVRAGIELLNAAGIPTYSAPEKGVRAFLYLAWYGRNQASLYETPQEIPQLFPLDKAKLRRTLESVLADDQRILSEVASKRLLATYEIPVTQTVPAASSEEAIEIANRIGYPVALKVASPDITHKSDVGGIELNLVDAAAVGQAFDRILDRVRTHRPEAVVEGVTVQPMIAKPGARELIVGAKRDPVFGMVLLVGAGGTSAELYQDTALELPPLSERAARQMLESLRCWPLLRGYRGSPPLHVERLIEVLMRLSYLIADCPEIVELDVNPLLVTADEVIALDARIVVDHEIHTHPPPAYSHLAIRPYPEDFTKTATLTDGSVVLLRPIKPEDEPMWHELVSGCSPETIRLRFRCLFRSTTHLMATRFCFVDYDRELPIVAEMQVDGGRKLVGMGQLVSDADHRQAEFAVLVGDSWQRRGLGALLTDYCLEIADSWNIQSIDAEIAPQNHRMIQMLSKRGFTMDWHRADDVVIARKMLPSGQPAAIP